MKMFLVSDNTHTYAGLRLAGIEGVVVHEEKEVREAILSVIKDSDVGILLITEKLCKLCPALVSDIKLNYRQPLVVEIPDRHGSGRDEDFIMSYIKDAIGVKL